VVKLCQCTGIEEIAGKSALFPKGNDGLGKRTRDRRQRLANLLQADVIMFGFRPFLGREVSLQVLADFSSVGDRQRDLLPLFKLKRPKRLENAIFVYGLKPFLHAPSV